VVVARYGQVLPNSTRKEISRRSLDHSFGLAAIVLDIASGKFASLELPGPVPVPLTVHRRAFGSGGGTLDSEQRHVGQLYLFWRAAADSGRAEGFLTAFWAEENIPTVYTCPLQKDAVCDATKGDSRSKLPMGAVHHSESRSVRYASGDYIGVLRKHGHDPEHEPAGEVHPKIRVPKLCPRPAFLALLLFLAQRRINNLHVINGHPKNKSPSPHHRNKAVSDGRSEMIGHRFLVTVTVFCNPSDSG
jgi:hypothetical protein